MIDWLKEPVNSGAAIGLILGGVFLLFQFRRHRALNLAQFVIVILSGVATATGIDFARIILTTSKQELGILGDYRLSMLLGSVAVIWTAVETVARLFFVEPVSNNDKENVVIVPEDKKINTG